MKLAELLNRQQDIAERTYTGLFIVLPRDGNTVCADYYKLEDYRVSGRTGTGVLPVPNDYEQPVENLDSAEWAAKKFGEAHRQDPGNWTLIAKPGFPERWEQYK